MKKSKKFSWLMPGDCIAFQSEQIIMIISNVKFDETYSRLTYVRFHPLKVVNGLIGTMRYRTDNTDGFGSIIDSWSIE